MAHKGNDLILYFLKQKIRNPNLETRNKIEYQMTKILNYKEFGLLTS
jgi:hypothetical protein